MHGVVVVVLVVKKYRLVYVYFENIVLVLSFVIKHFVLFL